MHQKVYSYRWAGGGNCKSQNHELAFTKVRRGRVYDEVVGISIGGTGTGTDGTSPSTCSKAMHAYVFQELDVHRMLMIT